MVEPYQVVCMQPPIHEAKSRHDVKQNISRITKMLGEMVFLQRRRLENRGSGDVKLVVFPEYCFSDWRKIAAGSIKGQDVAVEIPGPDVAPLAQAAKENRIFIAAQALENMAEFPGHFLNAMFIFGPDGELVYKRHKLRHGLLTLYTSPHDVLDRYMDLFSRGRSVGQTVFPVVDTELGKVGMCVCHEITTPEVARQLTANGAEVILRPTNEPSIYGRIHMDRARALENKVYWVVANSGYSVENTTIGDCGPSAIISFRGELLAESYLPDTTIWGLIDIERLRQARGPAALPLYASTVFDYHQSPSLPPNMFLDGPLDRSSLEAEYIRLGLIPGLGKRETRV